MKKITIFAAVALMAVMIVSCSDDEPTNPLVNLKADFVEAHTNINSALDYIITDDGTMLSTDKLYSVPFMPRPDTLYRAMLYYLPTEQGTVTPVEMALVPTITPKPLGEGEVMKSDPVEFESVWVSKTKKYLNLAFNLLVSGTDGAAKKHVIGFVEESVDTLADGKTITNIHFYHDSKGMLDYYAVKYYVSVPCSSFDTDSVNVKVMTYKGLVTKRLEVGQ